MRCCAVSRSASRRGIVSLARASLIVRGLGRPLLCLAGSALALVWRLLVLGFPLALALATRLPKLAVLVRSPG